MVSRAGFDTGITLKTGKLLISRFAAFARCRPLAGLPYKIGYRVGSVSLTYGKGAGAGQCRLIFLMFSHTQRHCLYLLIYAIINCMEELFSRIGQEALRTKLLNHPIVERLRNNPNWKPAADAAVDHFVDRKKCTIPSWIKSSTWKQVEMAFDEVMREQAESAKLFQDLGERSKS